MSSLITVIVPVADKHRPLLPRALYSLSQQTYTPEIIVVNDSEDSFDLDQIQVLNTGGHRGTAYARNLGLDAVRTPLTFFLDADDYLLDGALELMLRAYATYETCYIYSDWYQYNEHGYSYHKAQTYNRQKLFRNPLHLVSILIETDAAKSVYYDINYRGWEDVEFHIRLALAGYCGARVPEPLLIYDMLTSINRVKHDLIADEVLPALKLRYADYIKGEKEFMACSTCGGGKARALNVVTAMPPVPEEGMLVLEYLGENTAPITFSVGRNRYRGANDDSNKFVQVPYQDAQALLDKGMFRKVPKTVKPVEVPQPEQFNGWREAQPPTEVPQDWQKLFEQNAVKSNASGDLEPVRAEIRAKRRGRKPGSKNLPKPAPVTEAFVPTVETNDQAVTD